MSSEVTGPAALDLTEGREHAAPLWLLPDGALSTSPAAAPEGMQALEAMVTAARWISSRRTTSFERLFPPSAFHPERPARDERLSTGQGTRLLDQARGALRAAAVAGEEAREDPLAAAQLRSAALTVLSHLTATALRDPAFAPVAEQAAAEIFALVDAEQGDASARPALRAHAIQLLQLRAPALPAPMRDRARALVRSLVREAPPYAELTGPWAFAMCSGDEFYSGECRVLVEAHRFREIEPPPGTPAPPTPFAAYYRVFEAPFRTPAGEPVRIFARSATPRDENKEMGMRFFAGVFISRHAQLGAFDLRAATVQVRQDGYKLMLNAQCAGLTTRFAIARMFPDADIYSSWDSTYFRKNAKDEVSASEGVDCFVAALQGMSRGETHGQIEGRIRKAQWHHKQASIPGFVQFVGPSHPLVVARFSDVNQDGRADYYDGFLDFTLTEIAEDVHASLTPRDPGVRASQISGEAALGLNWAAGSLNRVTQYSELWAGLPGRSEIAYVFQSGGFYSHREPPEDVPTGAAPAQDLGRLPAVVRYQRRDDAEGGISAEVMMHSFLGHAAKEMKRLLCAAEAMQRAFDLGHLKGSQLLLSRAGQRGAVLLTLAGLLEFPADQNLIDALWSMALSALRLPEISRSLVRECITEEDHAQSNYYGSERGLRQLLSRLEKSDPVVHAQLLSEDPAVGRLAPLPLG